jgi:DNA polymerase elongation subunit (family B)
MFDLETFQETVSHVPYACGFSYGDHKTVNISYGKNCMRGFIEHIIKQQNKYICAFNGSGFDFYILINHLKDLNISISNLILSNGRVLSFKFEKEGGGIGFATAATTGTVTATTRRTEIRSWAGSVCR